MIGVAITRCDAFPISCMNYGDPNREIENNFGDKYQFIN